MRIRYLVLLPLVALAGCVTVPPYEKRFDDGLSTLQEQVYDHYAAIQLDPTGAACQGPGPRDFWQGARRTVDLLALRATYTPDYDLIHDQLTGLRGALDKYETIERVNATEQAAAGRTGRALCLPDMLAHASNVQLHDQIGAILKLELVYKRGDR